jgi:hypothetical protein
MNQTGNQIISTINIKLSFVACSIELSESKIRNKISFVPYPVARKAALYILDELDDVE